MDGRPLTVAQAADRMNVSERFIRRLIEERRIAFHRVGRHVRLRPVDLDAFFDAGRVEPVTRTCRPRLRSAGRRSA